MISINRVVMAVLIAVGLVACADDETGDANISVAVGALSSADVTTVRLTISGQGMSTITTTLAKTGSTWAGVIGQLPVGNARTFKGDAIDADGNVVYTGSLSADIKANKTTLVSLILQEVTPPPPFDNAAPRITGITLSTDAPATDEEVSIVVTSTDPNMEATLTEFSATGGTISGSPSGRGRFSASVDGEYIVTAKVTDPKGASDTIAVTVNVNAANGKGSASVTATVNTFPRVVNITSTAGRLAPGATVDLFVNWLDPDGDAVTSTSLNYSLSGTTTYLGGTTSSLGWRFRLDPATSPTATSIRFTWTVTSSAPRGGSGTGYLYLAVAPPPTPAFAPIVDSTYQSTMFATSGEHVVLRVSGHAHDGGPVTIDWSSSGTGTLSAPAPQQSSSEATWQAPTCFGGTSTVTAQLTDLNGNATTTQFSISPPAGFSCP